MKKNVSLWNKIKLFNSFKKTIKENKKELENKYKIRIDNAYRLYTVLNIPEELIGESYALKKSDIERISQNFIEEYGTELANFLNKQGLNELYKYYEIKKVDKYSYLLVFGYSLFESNKYYNNIYYKVLPGSIVASILLFLLFL
jgi:hypothetical protein